MIGFLMYGGSYLVRVDFLLGESLNGNYCWIPRTNHGHRAEYHIVAQNCVLFNEIRARKQCDIITKRGVVCKRDVEMSGKRGGGMEEENKKKFRYIYVIGLSV